MNAPQTAWTLQDLKSALEQSSSFSDGEITCTVSPDQPDVLEVQLHSAGEIILYMNVGETQILTSTVLWPRDAQDDPAAFEAMMLRNHKKLLPLCALSIDDVDGREYYELFGAMSVRSTLDSVETELRTIANSALELAADVGPKAAA
ncbi:YjfI family protein [Roseibium sp.]|uniref:YjfI family protein n=1 Tax=Roseibium sp. TaxID=1936156 RepID=UPI003BB10788